VLFLPDLPSPRQLSGGRFGSAQPQSDGIVRIGCSCILHIITARMHRAPLLVRGLFTKGSLTGPASRLSLHANACACRLPIIRWLNAPALEPWKHVTETFAPGHRDGNRDAFDSNAEPVPVAIIPDSPASACAGRYDTFRRGLFDLTGWALRWQSSRPLGTAVDCALGP
jgi:hypothetical protein